MNYYPFHIGDYKSHTEHLTPIEDIAYRRMIDWCFLHEKGLPKKTEEIARLIRMRTHCECIANVLHEFFTFDKPTKTWTNKRIEKEILSFTKKSEKRRFAAKARWDKGSSDANAMQTECKSNANQNQEPEPEPEPNKKGPKGPRGNIVSTRKPVPIKEVINKWNLFAEQNGLPQCVKQTKQIEGAIRQRWKEDLPELEHWDNFFDYISKSKFLMGKTSNGDKRPFRATLQWVTNPTNFGKIGSEMYHK